jgi:hypothetical protein
MTAVGPEELRLWLATRSTGTDEDLARPIVEFIAEAADRVYVATQQLEDREVVEALIAARQRGCSVRVLLENDYLTERSAVENPWRPSGRNESNRRALAALLRARVPVRSDRRHTLAHSNFVVRDPELPTAGVVLTSANLTPEGLRTHWNAAVKVVSGSAAEAFSSEFSHMWDDAPSDRGTDTPTVTEVAGIPVKPVFGPRQRPRTTTASRSSATAASTRLTPRRRGLHVGAIGVTVPCSFTSKATAARPLDTTSRSAGGR